MGDQENVLHLNKTGIRGLEANPKGTRFYPVAGFKGLCVQVTKAGVKSFVLRYRFHGVQRICTLGVFPAMTPEAAERAHAATWNLINAGTDPNQAKADAKEAAKDARRAAVKVNDLADRFIAEHIQGKERGRMQGAEAIRLINQHVRPALGELPLAKVGPADISALLYKMRGTPVQANRTRGVLRTMFGRAEEWELRPLGSNPVVVVKVRAPERKRDRRLTDLELKTLGAELGKSKEAPDLLMAVRLALLAGMRKGEVAELRWSWLDLEAGEIRIPAEFHKTGHKSGKIRVVYLCDALVARLKAAVRTLGCPYVVPGKPRKDAEGKPLPWEPIVGLQSPWERIREAAGLAPKDKEGDYINEEENPTWHDLRRTFASVGADLGLKGFVGELLGHAEATVTDIYTRSAAEPLHEAAEKIGTRIDGILSGAIDPEKEAQERREAKEAKTKGTA
ncbi:MAG: site-specific integrase [Holophaga sp.]|jgi:integrase